MMRLFVIFWVVFSGVAQLAHAQSDDEPVWIQVEAQPNLQDGITRARAYARILEDVNGFSLGNGWYGILLGPYTAATAAQALQSYRNDGLIPRDSYVVLNGALFEQIFPTGADLLQRSIETAEPAQQTTPQPLVEPDEEAAAIALQGLPQTPSPAPDVPDETRAEARRSEANLTPQERQKIQTALKWAGFYYAAIDGAFGRGTRSSMATWQSANGFEPTGVLTTAQRAALIQSYDALLDGLDLRVVTDAATGIEMILPMGAVAFDRYEAPFAHFDATGNNRARVLLISQEGDVNTLASLYEVMQTLEIVPPEGPRGLQRTNFSLIGQNQEIISETRVSLEGTEIKGFTLIWPVGDEQRRARLLDEMQASFRRLPGVLDPLAGAEMPQQIDLLAGLQIRQPRLSRSGFFVDGTGSVVTTAEAVENCSRITLDEEFDAELITVDDTLGMAVLKPATGLAPAQVARFSALAPRLQSDVAVAGYSYEGILGAPTVTFGTLTDLRGLRGEKDFTRLALSSLPGDAGGPVFDSNGNVLGMLLPRGEGARQLPPEVNFALAGPAISQALESAGLVPARADKSDALAPEDITQRALGVTVLVSCWD